MPLLFWKSHEIEKCALKWFERIMITLARNDMDQEYGSFVFISLFVTCHYVLTVNI